MIPSGWNASLILKASPPGGYNSGILSSDADGTGSISTGGQIAVTQLSTPSGHQGADTFGSWPTFYQNPQRSGNETIEPTVALNNASQLQEVWQFNTTGPVEGSLAVSNGTVYVGSWSHAGLYALPANRSGPYVTPNWHDSLGSYWSVGVEMNNTTYQTPCKQGAPGSGIQQNWSGITSTPAVNNGIVYVGGGNTVVYAVFARNGTVDWSTNLGNDTNGSGPHGRYNPYWPKDYIWSSPLFYHGSVYVGVASGCEGNAAGQLFQLNSTTGSIVGAFDTTPPGVYGATIWSTPTLDLKENTIWVTTGNEVPEGQNNTPYARSIIALNLSNISRVRGYWQTGTPGSDDDFGAGMTLMTASNGTEIVVSTNKDGYTSAFWGPSFMRATGTVHVSSPIWNKFEALYDVVPAAYNNSTQSLYVTSGGKIQSLLIDGGLQWSYTTAGDYVEAGLAMANGLLFAGVDGEGSNGALGSLIVLNATNGQLVYQFNVSQNINGEPVVADGRVFFGTGNYTLTGIGHVFALQIPLRAQPRLESATIASNSYPACRAPSKCLFASLLMTGSGGVPAYSCSSRFATTGPTPGCGILNYVIPINLSQSTWNGTLTTNDSELAAATAQYHFYVTYLHLQVCTLLLPIKCTWTYVFSIHACLPIFKSHYVNGIWVIYIVWLCGGPPGVGGCLVCIPYSFGYDQSSLGFLPIGQSWSFGDGTPLNLTSAPEHFYDKTGLLTVTLSVIDPTEDTYVGTFSINVRVGD